MTTVGRAPQKNIKKAARPLFLRKKFEIPHSTGRENTPHTMNKGTLIRYYPNETEHYTAVVTDKGLLQVKPRTLVAYDSLEDWCASLPCLLYTSDAADE